EHPGSSGPFGYLVIEPGLLAASEQEVRENALREAANQVEPRLRGRFSVLSPKGVSLRDFVERELRGGTLIRDEFLQRFERPYGTVYRQALLVDVSENQVDTLCSRFQTEQA